MLHTSLGFHTFTISKRITKKEYNTLLEDIKRYECVTKNIRFRPIKDHRYDNSKDEVVKRVVSRPTFLRIEYLNEIKGIHWDIFHSRDSYSKFNADIRHEEPRPYSIMATINPKIFSGIIDYLRAANESDIINFESKFNYESAKISSILENLSTYVINRIDYCINFDLRELGIDCTPELIMKLIKRADIPEHYTELTTYNETSHRKITDKNSFYLKSNSGNINCYYKYAQLRTEFPECPDLENSKDIIRFEVQCKYRKTYTLRNTYGNDINSLFSNDVCRNIIYNHYNRIIRPGDYYTLDCARKEIQNMRFHESKEKRLIDALEYINECRGIAKAKASLEGEGKGKDFEIDMLRIAIRDLSDLGINPVTIPKEYGIRHIPNLLKAYYDKIAQEEAIDEHRRKDGNKFKKK
jgi:hypothetical protein